MGLIAQRLFSMARTIACAGVSGQIRRACLGGIALCGTVPRSTWSGLESPRSGTKVSVERCGELGKRCQSFPP